MPSAYVMVSGESIWGHATTRRECVAEGLKWVEEWLTERTGAEGVIPSVGALYVIGATKRLATSVDLRGGSVGYVLHDDLGPVGEPTPDRLANLRPGAWADVVEYREE